MVIELLEDMESPITKGKQWRKGQLAYLDNDSSKALVKAGKAKVVEGEQLSKEAPKAPKITTPEE